MARTAKATAAPAVDPRVAAFTTKPSANSLQQPTEEWGHVVVAAEYEGGVTVEYQGFLDPAGANGIPGEQRRATRARATKATKPPVEAETEA